MNRLQRTPGRVGLSVIELIFALGILAFASAGVFTLFASNQYGTLMGPDQSSTVATSLISLKRLGVDLEAGTAFATPANAVGGVGVRASLSGGDAVEYYQDGQSLKKVVASTGTITTIATNVVAGTGLSLQYYDSSMNAISAPMNSTKYGQAAAVDVTLSIRLPRASFGQVTRTTRIVLRNKLS
jgi:hypothetical protein